MYESFCNFLENYPFLTICFLLLTGTILALIARSCRNVSPFLFMPDLSDREDDAKLTEEDAKKFISGLETWGNGTPYTRFIYRFYLRAALSQDQNALNNIYAQYVYSRIIILLSLPVDTGIAFGAYTRFPKLGRNCAFWTAAAVFSGLCAALSFLFYPVRYIVRLLTVLGGIIVVLQAAILVFAVISFRNFGYCGVFSCVTGMFLNYLHDDLPEEDLYALSAYSLNALGHTDKSLSYDFLEHTIKKNTEEALVDLLNAAESITENMKNNSADVGEKEKNAIDTLLAHALDILVSRKKAPAE